MGEFPGSSRLNFGYNGNVYGQCNEGGHHDEQVKINRLAQIDGKDEGSAKNFKPQEFAGFSAGWPWPASLEKR
jgi:hypothetical protein